MDIENSTVFIPGASSGIGLALALRLSERGSTVIIGGRRTALLESITQEHPQLRAVEIDTADPTSIQDASRRVIEEHPQLDAVILMAGIMRPENWDDPASALATAEEIVTTNLLGPLRLLAAFLEHLRTRPAATVMTVSSGLAHLPLRPTPTYNASKAAVHMLSETLRLQLEGTGVQVTELVPPAVRTDLMPGQAQNEHAMGLDAFADEVMELLEGEPEAHEVLVRAVHPLRYAEVRGQYEQTVAAVNAIDPHARR